ncbi:hypothetical protein MRB53_013281 [Persea americana]|uniref:Uncharacterized protein n=1 Tax=Persea americana TaxID=3435 RepID=A0ACC2K7J2_PERAE|nr:hypothetical protein MRB53_013281 [Persea americana]
MMEALLAMTTTTTVLLFDDGRDAEEVGVLAISTRERRCDGIARGAKSAYPLFAGESGTKVCLSFSVLLLAVRRPSHSRNPSSRTSNAGFGSRTWMPFPHGEPLQDVVSGAGGDEAGFVGCMPELVEGGEAVVREHGEGFASQVKGKGVPVFVMLPPDSVTTGNGVNKKKAMNVSLQALRSVGVEGVMVDVWRGLVEREGLGCYEASL